MEKLVALVVVVVFLGLVCWGLSCMQNSKSVIKSELPPGAEKIEVMGNGWSKFEVVVDGKRYKMMMYNVYQRSAAVKLEDMGPEVER